MKKRHYLFLACAILLTITLAFGAFALDYSSRQGNEATFETLEETRLSSPAAALALENDQTKIYASNPDLNTYPQGTTFVYRSANTYGSFRAAARMNTNIVVFSDKTFVNKETTLAYLQELGLIDIIEEASGSIVLITPSKPENGFGSADLTYFQNLQTVMLNQKASSKDGDITTYYSDAEYFGGYGCEYYIGIDGGATFLNNYVSPAAATVGRVAGMLLINGEMQGFRSVATYVPVYLVNAQSDVIEKYKAANSTHASSFTGDIVSYFNQYLPLRRVVVAQDENADVAAYIKDAYYNLFINAMRYSATGGTVPFSLCNRSAILTGGNTQNGVNVTYHFEDRFSDVKTADGEYLQSWYEVLPAEVLDGTAADRSIPLILALHGMGDDPLMFIDGNGYINLAASERVAVVAPQHQEIFWTNVNGEFVDGIESVIMPALVRYMLNTYPALDASRVYITGYSMGGWATMKTINGDPSLFAAAVPMSGMAHTGTPEQVAQFETVDIPIFFTTSTRDMGMLFDDNTGGIAANHQTHIIQYMGYNEMDKFTAFDFVAYPIAGFKADSGITITLNGEYIHHRWFLNNSDGIPMVGLGITEGLVHSLYPEFANIMWNFASRYSRNLETGAVVYQP